LGHRFRHNDNDDASLKKGAEQAGDNLSRKFLDGMFEIGAELVKRSVVSEDIKSFFSGIEARAAARRSAVDTMVRIVRNDPASDIYDYPTEKMA